MFPNRSSSIHSSVSSKSGNKSNTALTNNSSSSQHHHSCASPSSTINTNATSYQSHYSSTGGKQNRSNPSLGHFASFSSLGKQSASPNGHPHYLQQPEYPGPAKSVHSSFSEGGRSVVPSVLSTPSSLGLPPLPSPTQERERSLSSRSSRFVSSLFGRNKKHASASAASTVSGNSYPSTPRGYEFEYERSRPDYSPSTYSNTSSHPPIPFPIDKHSTTSSKYSSPAHTLRPSVSTQFSTVSSNGSTYVSSRSRSRSAYPATRNHQGPSSSALSDPLYDPSTEPLSLSDLVSLSSSQPLSPIKQSPPSSPTHPYSPHPFSVTKKSSQDFSVVSDRKKMDEENCPVCLEPLSLRLRGERPHVRPICGHRLHEACFEAVYGGVARARSKPGASLGLCGVCRRDMKLGDGGEGKGGKDKFAAISGLPGRGASPLDAHKMRSISKRTIQADGTAQSLHDPSEDDDLIERGSIGSDGMKRNGSGSLGRRGSSDTVSAGAEGGHHHHPQVVHPKITVRAEHPSVARTMDREKRQHLTCMVTVEIPPSKTGAAMANGVMGMGMAMGMGSHSGMKREGENGHGGRAPPSVRERDRDRHQSRHTDSTSSSLTPTPSSVASSRHHHPHHSQHHQSAAQYHQHQHQSGNPNAGGAGPSTSNARSPSPSHSVYSAYTYGATQAGPGNSHDGPDGPFASVVEDLQNRMTDWKGHSRDDFGALKMYDYLYVRKDKNIREFLVYLFEEALLCVSDDKRKGLTGKIVDGISGSSDRLRLRGRVYVRHIRKIEDTSTPSGDLSLTITMEDDNLDQFIMTFKERTSLQLWKQQIETLVQQHHNPPPPPSFGAAGSPRSPGDTRESVMSENTHVSGSTEASSNAPSGFSGSRGTTSSAPTSYVSSQVSSQTIPEDEVVKTQSPPYPGSAPLSLTPPRPFLSLDLMLILSVPSLTNAPSSFHLKVRLIKSTLDFVIANAGPLTRISIVTFSSGEGSKGVLRKTPFIAVGKQDGRRRLQAVVNDIGSETRTHSGETFGMIEHKEDRVNVVTAVNLALDVVLQRKAKSSLTGMVLMNDGKDGAQKQQMDLVMARAEAANVPIHAFGWGKAHDPSSLWLLSNHTSGTYTFIREWYHLRDCLAGCIGGMLSTAVTNLRLHLNVPERRWFRIRKVAGTQGAIVATDGKDADIDLGELRAGEKKEMLVEVELAFNSDETFERPGTSQSPTQVGRPGYNTATDEFFLKKVGLSPAALDDFQSSNFYEDDLFDGMIDEVPIFEVNAAYRDPVAGKYVSRLPYPSLLTVTVTPPVQPGSRSPPLVSDPAIVRRRLELLVADMLTRTLLLMSRRNDAQAQRLLTETKRIVTAIMSNLAPMTSSSPKAYRRTSQHHVAHAVLIACLEDIDIVLEGTQNRDMFDSNQRNYAAQQAVVLRDQKAWTPRSGTERVFFTAENAIWMIAQSQQWLARTGDE